MSALRRLAIAIIGVIVLGPLSPSPTIGAEVVASDPIKIDGPVSGTWLGGFIRSAGDVNGDGREDIVVGRYTANGGWLAPEGSTAAIVLYGSKALASLSVGDMTVADGFRIWPSGGSDGSGTQVDGAGDVNRDGYDDVIVASSWAASSGRPVAHVLFGGPSHPDVNLAGALGAGGVTIEAPAALGGVTGVAGAGDVNGDGFADYMIGFGNGGFERRAGSVFLIHGSASSTNVDLSTATRPQVVRIDGQAGSTGLGVALAAGDVNNDGKSDLVLRTDQDITTTAGSITVIWGRSNLPNIDLTLPPVGVASTTSVPRIGGSREKGTLAVGDVNGDGRADLIVGDPDFRKDDDPYSRQGSVLVILGGSGFPGAQWRIIGNTYHDQLGGWVAARDIDGDGKAEIATTAFLDVVPGVTYVVRGRTATTTIDLSVPGSGAWWTHVAPSSAERAGEGVAIADVTGDRVADLLVSDPTTEGYAGSVLIVPTVDSVAPTTTKPSRTLSAGSAILANKLPIRVAWTARDTQSGVARVELGQSTDGGPWTTVSTTLTSSVAYRQVPSGHTYRFRVRAVDHAGNIGSWAYGATMKVSGVSQASASVRYAGTWANSTSTTWWGGTAKSSSRAGSTARYTFTGKSIAWVGLKGIGRGKANVYINGVLKATVDLYSPTTLKQRIIWSANYGASATRTIMIKVHGTSGRPRVDVDGFIVGS